MSISNMGKTKSIITTLNIKVSFSINKIDEFLELAYMRESLFNTSLMI